MKKSRSFTDTKRLPFRNKDSMLSDIKSNFLAQIKGGKVSAMCLAFAKAV